MDLKELRETFRVRMKEEDFCIGEEQVEKLFRELLEEPEPPEPKFEGGHISVEEIVEIHNRVFTADKVKKIFEGDSAFYKAILDK